MQEKNRKKILRVVSLLVIIVGPLIIYGHVIHVRSALRCLFMANFTPLLEHGKRQ